MSTGLDITQPPLAVLHLVTAEPAARPVQCGHNAEPDDVNHYKAIPEAGWLECNKPVVWNGLRYVVPGGEEENDQYQVQQVKVQDIVKERYATVDCDDLRPFAAGG